ncbi:hypothetical protein CSHISOI_09447, partial [Colletotrichum shisoi]
MKSYAVAGLACIATGTAVASPLLPLAVPPGVATSPASTGPASEALQQTAASLPSCATGCVAAELPKSACNAADLQCICTNQQLNAAIGVCLSQNCTVVESLRKVPSFWCLFRFFRPIGLTRCPVATPEEAQNYSKTSCGVPVRRNTEQAPISWALFAVAFVAVVARILSKAPALNPAFPFGMDDWTIIAAMVALIPSDIGSQKLIELGIGKDIWTVPPENITEILLCGNITLMTFINGGVNITLDFVLFVLPVTQFITVSWTSKKKIGVSVIFLVGLFVTACSGIRLATVGRFANTQNPTYDFKEISIWSLVEMRMSVICA